MSPVRNGAAAAAEMNPRVSDRLGGPVLACFDPQWPNLNFTVAYFERGLFLGFGRSIGS
jgi:hypothetical protein